MQLRLSLNLVLAFSILCSSPVLAAVRFHGRVLDTAGLPIRGARATAYPMGSEAGVGAVSDGEGRFRIDLEPGDYVIAVQLKNFEDAAETVTIGKSDASAHDFVLNPATFKETITVRAEDGYRVSATSSATKTDIPLRNVPQAVTVVTQQLMRDQLMSSIGDVVRYVPGVMLHQGENNRDQVIMRGNSSSADFFVDGVRDDVQYYRDLYNLERVEAIKGPNALIFGRGGAGGVINRVTKEAGFAPLREVAMQGGTFDNRRLSADINEPLGSRFALRLNGVFENSGSFRDFVSRKRTGIAPSLTFLASDATKIAAGFEHFRDTRTADRGISSYRGRPADVDIATFYGNPNDSHVRADADLASIGVDHRAGSWSVRNKTFFGRYDRGYQNYVPGAVSADKSRVALTAYNNATERQNIFNQTDFTFHTPRHMVLVGSELGTQSTSNLRNTGYFNDSATSILVPYESPQTSTPVTFRQSATDAKNHVRTNVAAMYAQDQFEMSSHAQLIGGVRVDRFALDYRNLRNNDRLSRTDTLVSPRAGVVVKPFDALSLYGSYSVSFLPGSGDQFSSLTSITQQLEPERFDNYEVGTKWDRDAVSITAAVYRLDRTNTRATDPNDPTRIVQTGSQRTNGFEIGVNGQLTSRWSLAGGYANQDAFVMSATATAKKGAHAGQVPRQTFSLWNNVQIHPLVSAGLGVIHRSSMFATIDNSVVLPGYTEVDGALFVTVAHNVRLQLNVENLFDVRYYANADSNTNISPGSGRAVRAGLTMRF